MGSQNLSLDEAMRAQMRVHLSLIPLATLVSPLLCQLKFNGGVSSSSSNSNSPSANRNTNNNNRPTDVDEKFFFGGDTPSLTGNQEIDGEERFFLPTGQGCTCNTNGRRRRQAPGEDQPGTRFFGGLFGGQQPHCGSCCYNSQPFNNNNGFNSNFQNQGFNNQNQGFNNQGFNSQNQGFNNQNNGRCQCDYSLT